MNDDVRYIRASMLPSYNDCARRAAANQFRGIVQAVLNWEVPQEPRSIQASVGTAAHTWIAELIRRKMRGEDFVEDFVPEFAIEEMTADIAAGINWDEKTTATPNEAKEQITKIGKSFAYFVLPYLQPAGVELELIADAGGGYHFIGHLDDIETDGGIIDWKTGKKAGGYHAQIGTYSLLARTNGFRAGDRHRVIRLPRMRGNQIEPETYYYDRRVCEVEARATADGIKRDLERFERTRDPRSFAANPNSIVCSNRYCSVWGTPFCHLGKEVDK